jgi:hypothetical protein
LLTLKKLCPLSALLCCAISANSLLAQNAENRLANLTIYNAGVGEFLEERSVELQTGTNTVEWRSLMPKAFIRTIRVVAENAEVTRQSVTFDGVHVNNERSAVLHLVIQNNGPAVRKRIRVDYLAPNVSWVSEHSLVLGTLPEGSAVNAPIPAELDSWVSIHNNTGIDLAPGAIDLVAGDIALLTNESNHHQQNVSYQSNVCFGDGSDNSSGESYTDVGSLSAFNRFTLGKNLFMGSNATISRFPIFQHAHLSVVQRNVFENKHDTQTFGRGGFILLPQGLEVRLVAKNPAEAPLSAGQVTVYQRSGDFAQIVGQDRIGFTPQKGEFTISQGRSSTLFGTRRILEHKRVNYQDNDGHNNDKMVTKVEVVIQNRGSHAAETMVREDIERYDENQWKVLASSDPHEKLGSNTLQFVVQIPAGQKKTLTYTVECR